MNDFEKRPEPDGLGGLYPGIPEHEVRERLDAVTSGFDRVFGHEGIRLFSAPGRTELGGNHTDHQRGLVIAAAVALDDVAAAAPSRDRVLRIHSETYGSTAVRLDDLSPIAEEAGTPASLVRGVADGLAQAGYRASGGFDAYISGCVPVGSGLSSSAAFEVLVAAVMNGLLFGGELTPYLMARAGQYAENRHFGKPCGLMDQIASASGGINGIDFKDPDAPALTRLSLDFADFGYALCIIDTGAKHDQLVGDYAAIPAEMTGVAKRLGAERLREIPAECFYDALPDLRCQVSDRAILRAMHYFEENARVRAQLDALRKCDIDSFLELVRESGYSSWMLLQNITPSGSAGDQPAALALAWCRRLLGASGACRIHGGGFGGTIQAIVPLGTQLRFREDMERVTGAGSCRFLKIRESGAVEITL